MVATDVGLQLLANVPAFYYGTSPNKFFDYIASGVPPLINYPGWLAELVNEHHCGFAVPPDDPAAFADALEARRGRPRRTSRMGERAPAGAGSSSITVLAAQVRWLEGAVGAGCGGAA